MSEGDRLRVENETLRSRFSRLTEAILRISEGLDLDTVLQEVVDGARSLVGAKHGAILIFDDSGRVRDFITSGVTPEERERVGSWPSGSGMLGYLNEVDGPVRLPDISAHPSSVGVPKDHPPIKTFLGTQIRAGDKGGGNIYLAGKEDGREFTLDDEETLEMFATQAAMAIANARRYGEERRAKADLEALVNTSPGGRSGIRRKNKGGGEVQSGGAPNHQRGARTEPHIRAALQHDDLPPHRWAGDPSK